MIRYYLNMSIVNCKELFCTFRFTGKTYHETFNFWVTETDKGKQIRKGLQMQLDLQM